MRHAVGRASRREGTSLAAGCPEARLAEAFAEVREDRAPELADILTQRAHRVDLRTPTGDGMFVSLKDYLAWKEKYPPPFNVFVASPYMRALATAYEAKRRYTIRRS